MSKQATKFPSLKEAFDAILAYDNERLSEYHFIYVSPVHPAPGFWKVREKVLMPLNKHFWRWV